MSPQPVLLVSVKVGKGKGRSNSGCKVLSFFHTIRLCVCSPCSEIGQQMHPRKCVVFVCVWVFAFCLIWKCRQLQWLLPNSHFRGLWGRSLSLVYPWLSLWSLSDTEHTQDCGSQQAPEPPQPHEVLDTFLLSRCCLNYHQPVNPERERNRERKDSENAMKPNCLLSLLRPVISQLLLTTLMGC